MRVRAKVVASVLLSVSLLATACGARLTAAQRAAGIGALTKNGGSTTGSATGGTTGATTGSSIGGTTGATGATTGGAAGGTTGGANNLGSGSCSSGGATDTGVTANQITLATVADVSGVQPGLFKSAWQAMSAVTAYINSQGGICGRQLKDLQLDSQADSTQNRAAVQQACTQSFALVGSMSAFDDGGASVGQQCGIPDISAITVNAARSNASNVYPAYPVGPNYINTSWGLQIKQRYPDAIKKSAFITLNAGASVQNGNQRIKALSIVRLQKAMQQAGWFPQVRVWDSVAYSPAYLSQGGTAVQSQPSGCNDVLKNVPCPAYVFLNTALFQEASSNPEMQLYLTWLQRVAPGAQPDYFGLYAWSAGRLFQKAATMVGAKLTRKALFSALQSIHSWNDFGLHIAHDIGAKREGNCTLYVEIKSSGFVRAFPASGWTCTGSLMKTS
ncbi:MAG: hypothetical protein E6G04_11165 [Actinobacteria bacterium]|nr:MAG: hypothetical protein E6G04_11165 [Actinomycetota bacterium]